MTRRKRRSRAYPVESLAAAEATAEALWRSLGRGAFDRATGVEALGYESASGGVGARRLAALVQYGLLFRRNGRYGLTPRGERLLRPGTEAERAAMRREAALAPPLHGEVHQRFRSSGRLPVHLGNLLVRELGITEVAADGAAATLRETFRHAGLVDPEDRFLSVEDETAHPAETARALPREPSARPPRGAAEEASRPGRRFELGLSHGRAVLELPRRVTPVDLRLLRLQLEVLETRLETEATDGGEGEA